MGREREREKGGRKVRSESKSCRSPKECRLVEGGITEPVVSCAIFARDPARPIRGEGPTIKRYFVVDVDEPDRSTAHHFETSTGSRVALSSGSEHWVTASQPMYPPRYLGYNVVITSADIPTYPPFQRVSLTYRSRFSPPRGFALLPKISIGSFWPSALCD